MFRERKYGGFRKRLIQIAALVLCLAAVALPAGRRSGRFLPDWIDWQSGSIVDASGRYRTVLKRGMARLDYDNNVIWKTPRKLKVQDAHFADVDGDGADELVLLCWKVGRFGQSRPFWVEEDEKSWSQHIFVYTCVDGAVRPKWQSSYIGVDVAALAVRGGAKQDGDTAAADVERAESGGRDAAAVNRTARADRRQRLLITDTDGGIGSWVWDSWGFVREDTDISFTVFGDLLIHEPIWRYGLEKRDGCFDFLFADSGVRRMIEESDICVINQETPLADDPADYGDYPRFGVPVGVGQAVADAGFDAVTYATNHALDLGPEGARFTEQYYVSRGVRCLGLRPEDVGERTAGGQGADDCAYTLIVRGGARIALFNYTYGVNGDAEPGEPNGTVYVLDDEARVRRQLAKARTEADIVIVFVHWGTEYAEEADEEQRRWAEIFLESGVDVTVGAHPHVLQPCETLRSESGREMTVWYSVGNYVSAQREVSCVKGGAAQFTVSLTAQGYRVTDCALRPLAITREADGAYTVEPAEDLLP